MPQWEYLDIYIGNHSWVTPDGISNTLDEIRPKEWTYPFPSFHTLLNQLGSHGWELSGVIAREGGETEHLLFKRPKP
jgi:hypothetical protein